MRSLRRPRRGSPAGGHGHTPGCPAILEGADLQWFAPEPTDTEPTDTEPTNTDTEESR
ncbi:hypothetical protein [Agromyces intestinalis]|uniref:hypothetical protein n=1 Tax=Agromyces intestinalis TaxID=2592652 RepID=UPI00143D19DA|nr:hypothetical protein [Agromyces intestinalis]